MRGNTTHSNSIYSQIYLCAPLFNNQSNRTLPRIKLLIFILKPSIFFYQPYFIRYAVVYAVVAAMLIYRDCCVVKFQVKNSWQNN